MSKIKVQIKSLWGSVLFEAEKEDYTVKRALRDAVLQDADLRGADLRGIPLKNLPQDYVNLCSRDILFVLEHLKPEVPFLKDKLLAGQVDGSQYEGRCACLVGSLAKAAEGSVEAVCQAIPYYKMDVRNPGEQWFLNINEGDTPKTNEFSKHAVRLCNMVLGLPDDDGLVLEAEGK